MQAENTDPSAKTLSFELKPDGGHTPNPQRRPSKPSHEDGDAVVHLRTLVEAERARAAVEFAQAVRDLVIPPLTALSDELPPRQRLRLESAVSTLREIFSPFFTPIRRDLAVLTPAELRVCLLIRQGMACKQIAMIEGISPATVGVHRRNIRRKLGLVRSKRNLQAFLNAPPSDRNDSTWRNG